MAARNPTANCMPKPHEVLVGLSLERLRQLNTELSQHRNSQHQWNWPQNVHAAIIELREYHRRP